MNLKNKKILITGASFIGSHLIPRLIKEKVGTIRIVNLTNKHKFMFPNDVEFITRDLRSLDDAVKSVKGMDVVIHLACDHGGRGYIDKFQANTTTNLILDGSIFSACLKQGVKKVFYSSSACVYPVSLQNNFKKKIFLKEDMTGPPYEPDNMYGWGKLMGELTLKTYFKEYGLNSVIGRFFTVYGEHATESHALIATIAKAFVKQDPFEIWGDGQQIRNWTYVTDVIEGIFLSLIMGNKAQSVNLGTSERTKVIDMVKAVFDYTGFHPKKLVYQKKPSGPLNRVADNALAFKMLGWKPKYSFSQGLQKTIDWYYKTKSVKQIEPNLNKLLIEK